MSMMAACRKETYFPLVRLGTRHTVTVSHHLQQCTPSIDGGRRLYTTAVYIRRILYDSIKQHNNYGHMCAQNKQYTKKWYGCARVVFGGCELRSQHRRCRSMSQCRIMQRSSYRKHTQVPISQKEFHGSTANMVCFIAFRDSHPEAAGCEGHYASADADRLIVLTASGVAD